MKKRSSGILLHITSLPSPCGIGDLGPEAFRFVDFLAQAKQSYWQILPLNPIDPAFGNSPYHSISGFAFNTLLISPELMIEEELLHKTDVEPVPHFPLNRVDYSSVIPYRRKLLNKALARFKKRGKNDEYKKFCMENSYWLDDFALFVTLKVYFKGRVWSKWPSEIRDRQPEALQSLENELHDKIEEEKTLQYIFYKQWLLLKQYCHQKRIRIVGDMPIYMDYNSVDLWAHPELFKLNHRKRPYAVAGVPPDYFSDTGQLWGNPLYRWDVLKERKYDWWIQRMEHNLKFYDIVRIDHFRGFVGYWEVPATEKTAINGKWIEAPAADFFQHLNKRFHSLPIIAEDLGTITPDVRDVMRQFSYPGMKVLIFAFGEDDPMHPYLPHNYEKNCVVYSGTHDNNTVRGWFEKEAKSEDKKRFFRYIGREISEREIHWEFIRLAMMSVANTVIFPMQDVLGLGAEARMNRPATSEGNWLWRLLPEQLTSSLAEKLLEIMEISGRAESPDENN